MSGVRLSRELTDLGFSPGELSRLARSGQLVHVRRGAYADPGSVDLDERSRHRQLIEATVRLCSADAVLSHHSAAALHGFPLWRGDLERVQLTRNRVGGGRTRAPVQIFGHPFDERDVALVDGRRTTTRARTVLDLACATSLVRAVSVGDAALRLGTTSAELTAQLDRAVGRRGVGAARRAIAMLDRRSESPGESHSRVVLSLAGIIPPELQYDVFDRRGRFVGRTDFAWPDLRTVGEFDGRVKYGRAFRPDQDPAEVVYAEKLREDALRDLGWEVVRWVTADLADPARLMERLNRAFVRGARSS